MKFQQGKWKALIGVGAFFLGSVFVGVSLAAPARTELKPVVFPKGFLWGAATAAHQVEGGIRNDWYDYERTPGNIANGDTSWLAVDHYNRFDEDFGLAQNMGHNAHRFSIEWARIEPRKGEIDPVAVEHYHQVFRSLKKHGLRPMVTLHHFTNPQWVAAQGAWLNAKTIEDFARFARFLGREYGAEVDDWITMNEPNIYVFQSYQGGVWPPQKKSFTDMVLAMDQMARGHIEAYRELHAADHADADLDGSPCLVGVSQHIAIFDPMQGGNLIDEIAAAVVGSATNEAFLGAVTRNGSAVDFIGMNFYTRWRCQGTNCIADPKVPHTPMGWEIYPVGMYRALQLVNKYTSLPDGRKVPIMITENGIDDRGSGLRNEYFVQHLQQVARAIEDGIDVRGYLHWTLMDNFEWDKGYSPRFGLYSVDRSEGAGLRRIPTSTVPLFREIALSNSISTALLKKFGQND